MKNFLTSALVIIAISFGMYADDAPSWVGGVPYNTLNYFGIGSADKSEENYQEAATQRALRALASQIEVDVAAESLVKTMEVNGIVGSDYEEEIKVNVAQNIQGHRLIESWQDDNEYWVYYELNRFDYEERLEAIRDRAISAALDLWIKGNAAVERGDITSAATMYVNGLESLSEVMYEDLKCTYNGATINIATELYHSLTTLWSDVVLVTNPTALDVELLKGAESGIAIGCYKGTTPLSGVDLSARFTAGAGSLTQIADTNTDGVSALYITSVTSKQTKQQIEISALATGVKSKNKICNAILSSIDMPSVNVVLNLVGSGLTAYVMDNGMEIESLTNGIAGLISNGYFDVVTTPARADLIVKVESTFAKGGEVRGDLYNTREYSGTFNMSIIDNRTQRSVGYCNIDRVSTLLQLNASTAQAKQALSREIIKRVNRELPKIASQIKIDQSEPLPSYIDEPQNQPIPLPIVTPPISKPDNEVTGVLERGVKIIYNGFTTINDSSEIEMTIINERDSEYTFAGVIEKIFKIYNEKGGMVRVKSVQIAGNVEGYSINQQIISGVPTKMIVTVEKLQSIALLQIKDMKLRGLK